MITLDPSQIISLSLRATDLQAVCEAIKELPFKIAEPLLKSIMGQIEEQLSNAEPVITAVPSG